MYFSNFIFQVDAGGLSGSMTNLQNGLAMSLQNLAVQTQKSGLVCNLPTQEYENDEFEQDPDQHIIYNNKNDAIFKSTDL